MDINSSHLNNRFFCGYPLIRKEINIMKMWVIEK